MWVENVFWTSRPLNGNYTYSARHASGPPTRFTLLVYMNGERHETKKFWEEVTGFNKELTITAKIGKFWSMKLCFVFVIHTKDGNK